MGHYNWLDYLVMALYFLLIVSLGFLIWWNFNRKSLISNGYLHFIPVRIIWNFKTVISLMPSFKVGMSIFGGNVGSAHFKGLAGSAAAEGIGMVIFELSAVFFLLLLGWYFAPVYISSDVLTMPEYCFKRFGGQRITVCLSLISLFLYIITYMIGNIYTSSMFINSAIDFTEEDSALVTYGSLISILVVAYILSSIGGLPGLIWTDCLQALFMICGGIVISVEAFQTVGGYEELIEKFFNESYISNENCNEGTQATMSIIESMDASLYLFGLSVSSLWYWCANQTLVQRILTAKDIVHAKRACILASYLKLLPLWIMIFPGMAARSIYSSDMACNEDCCDNGCTMTAYVLLVENTFQGLRGLMCAVMITSSICSLMAVFNTVSNIFSMDIYNMYRPTASSKELFYAGRIFTFVLLLVSVSLIHKTYKNTQLYDEIQTWTCCLAPPIASLFFLAIFWTRTNESGAFWGLISGTVIGTIRLALEYGYSEPPCTSPLESDEKPPEWWYRWVKGIHYLNFGFLLFVVSVIITILISIVTRPNSYQNGLTYWSLKQKNNESPKRRLRETGFEQK